MAVHKVSVSLMHCTDAADQSPEMLGKSVGSLRAHGFATVEARTESGDIRDVMSADYCEPFDLVVLGKAHGKSGVVEFFTGSLRKDRD